VRKAGNRLKMRTIKRLVLVFRKNGNLGGIPRFWGGILRGDRFQSCGLVAKNSGGWKMKAAFIELGKSAYDFHGSYLCLSEVAGVIDDEVL